MTVVRFAFLGALVLGAPAFAEDLDAPVKLPPGAIIELTTEKTIVTTQGEKTTGEGVVVISKFRQTVTPIDTGYRVDLKNTSVDFQGATPTEASVLAAANLKAPDLTFEAEADLSPTRIRDWPTVLESLMMTVQGVVGASGSGSSAQAIAATRATLSALSPEQAADTLLKEHNLIALPQYLPLDFNRPIRGSVPVVSPLGGTATGYFQFELTSIDRNAGKAVVETKEGLEPTSLNAIASTLVENIRAQMPPGQPGLSDAELAQIKVDRTTGCRYEIDLSSGLATLGDCTTTIHSFGDGSAAKRVERVVIRQALIRP